MLDDSLTFGTSGSFGSAEKKFSINFSKANTKFCLSLHYNPDNSYLFVNGKEIVKIKANNKNVNFLAQFCLGNISNGSLKVNVYGFSADCNSIVKFDILNIHKYLMIKNNIKQCSAY